MIQSTNDVLTFHKSGHVCTNCGVKAHRLFVAKRHMLPRSLKIPKSQPALCPKCISKRFRGAIPREVLNMPTAPYQFADDMVNHFTTAINWGFFRPTGDNLHTSLMSKVMMADRDKIPTKIKFENRNTVRPTEPEAYGENLYFDGKALTKLQFVEFSKYLFKGLSELVDSYQSKSTGDLLITCPHCARKLVQEKFPRQDENGVYYSQYACRNKTNPKCLKDHKYLAYSMFRIRVLEGNKS